MSDYKINYVNKIIDMDKYNGRVNIIEQPSPDVQFKMQERLAIKNKTTESALKWKPKVRSIQRLP